MMRIYDHSPALRILHLSLQFQKSLISREDGEWDGLGQHGMCTAHLQRETIHFHLRLYIHKLYHAFQSQALFCCRCVSRRLLTELSIKRCTTLLPQMYLIYHIIKRQIWLNVLTANGIHFPKMNILARFSNRCVYRVSTYHETECKVGCILGLTTSRLHVKTAGLGTDFKCPTLPIVIKVIHKKKA